ncbi:MAG: hypothetical protein M1480_15530 [Bacteroidetes bacterium]|nr:hypothetical protein [Bacteroidota bacterium]
MKKYIILILAAILYSCSSTKIIELTALSQTPCKDVTLIKNPKTFIDSVESLKVFQKDNNIVASMEVKALSSSRFSFDVERKGSHIKLKMKDISDKEGDYVGIMNVTASFRSFDTGKFKIDVTDITGKKILASTEVEVK